MRLPNGYGSVYKLTGNRRRPWVVKKSIEGKQGVAAWGITLTSHPTNKYTDFYPEDYSYIGNDKPHNNMQPYVAVYIFRRSA